MKSAILIILLGGWINGSFVVPAKYIKNMRYESIWLWHSIIGLIAIPWLILFFLFPNNVYLYGLLQLDYWGLLFFGGLLFGAGQVCFAYAIERIGIILSFAINLGIGVTIGSLYVIFQKNAFFTVKGYHTLFAIFLILISLMLYFFSSRGKQNQWAQCNNYYQGWWLAIFAGISSGLQNIVFMTVASVAYTKQAVAQSFWVWPPFLFMAALSMVLGFFYRLRKKPQAIKIEENKQSALWKLWNACLIFLMGLCFTGSLALYSTGMNHLEGDWQMVGWLIFMISIIFASQCWGLFFRERRNLPLKSKIYQSSSVILLAGAIIALTF